MLVLTIFSLLIASIACEEACPELTCIGDQGNSWCMDATYETWNENGEMVTCTNVCPTMCNWENEIMCPNPMSEDGCYTGDWCMAVDMNSTCPQNCPVTCQPNQMICSHVWGDGCVKDYCADATYELMNADGDMVTCPNVCESATQCNWETEMMCPNPPSEDGCYTGSYCMPFDPEAPCPAKCPMTCGATGIICSETWNGCTYEWCQPMDMPCDPAMRHA